MTGRSTTSKISSGPDHNGDIVGFDGLILAGGRGRRLGGKPKSRVQLAGRSFAERAADALAAAERVAFVGPTEEAPSMSIAVREEPPGSGPVAGLAAGLDVLDSELVFVLAVDHPFVSAPLVESLLENMAGDGRILVDDEDRDQPLVGAYRREALERALENLDDVNDVPVSRLVIGLELDRVEGGAAAIDCDTPEDLALLQRIADEKRDDSDA